MTTPPSLERLNLEGVVMHLLQRSRLVEVGVALGVVTALHLLEEGVVKFRPRLLEEGVVNV